MFNIFKKYLLNFWIWWYIVQHKIVLMKLAGMWGYMLGMTNVMPMLQNLFKPLFQDYTQLGRFIAFPIRSTWVLVGSMIQLVITVPLLILYLIYIALPLTPIWAIASYFISSLAFLS